MALNDLTDAVSVAEETALSSAHAPRKTPEAAELQLLPGEDGGEWEGFYDDGDGWVEL